MALEKSTVSLNLGKTQSNANDDFSSPASQHQAALNITWDKDLRYSKRPGQEELSNSVVSDFANPDTIGTSSIPSQVFSHNEQLMMQNKGSLYSWDDQRDSWVYKGHHYPLTSKTNTIATGELSMDMPKSVIFGDYAIYAYRGTDKPRAHRFSARIQIKQISTGLFLLNDYELDVSDDYIDGISILSFTSKVFVTWCSSADIKICEVTPSTGAVGSTTTLKADYLNGKTYRVTPDWTVSNKSGVGERAFCVYVDSSNALKVFSVDNTGAYDATIGTYSTSGGVVLGGFSIYYSEVNQRLYIGSQHDELLGEVTVRILNFTSSGFTLVTASIVDYYPSFSTVTIVPNGRLKSSAFIDDPYGSGKVIFFYSTDYRAYFSNTTSENSDDLKYIRFTDSSVGADPLAYFARCVSLASRPFYDATRDTIYLPAIHYSSTQGTFFLLDFYKGKYEDGNPYAFVQLKTNYRNQTEINSSSLPSVCVSGSNVFVATTIGVRIAGYSNNVAVYHTAICEVEVNLAPDHTGQNKYLAGATYLTGGYLAQYDGQEVSEHNFFLQPTTVEAYSPPGTTTIIAEVVTHGSGAGHEISKFTFMPGPFIKESVTASSFCMVYYSPTVSVKWNYSINGVGTAPTGGNYNLLIDLNGNETAGEVAKKTLSAIIYNTPMTAYPDTNTYNIIYFESHTNADTPDCASSGFTYATSSTTTGLRQYCVIWSWIDANGNQHRSAPSNIASTSSAGHPVSVVAYCPTLTNRSISSVRMEVYATIDAGSTFYRYADIVSNQPWRVNSGSVGMIIDVSDSALQTGEILYTTGGVIENGSIGVCDSLSVIKNRLVVGHSESNNVYYSKVATNGLPVEMAETFFVSLDNDGRGVIGHSALDDKWIIFTDKSVVAFAGDGANNLGQGVSFSLPQVVSSDVGCRNANSIETGPNGLFFDSKMGISLLTRGLEVVYPGENVKDLNSYPVERAVVLKNDNKVREIRFILNNSRIPIYHYLKGRWAEWSGFSGTDACLWNGVFTRVDTNGRVWVESSSNFYDGNATDGYLTYNMSITTTWLKVKNMQDWQRIYRAILLGRLHTRHTLRVRAYYDYDTTNYDEYLFDTVAITGSSYDDSVYQPEIHLKRQKCEAIQLEIAAIPYGASGSTTEKCADFIDLSFQVGIKQGLAKVSAGKRL